MAEKICAIIKVSADSNDELIKFLIMCGTIEMVGLAGTRRTLPVVIDGDGSGKLHFEVWNGKKYEDAPIPKVADKEPLEKIHIGE